MFSYFKVVFRRIHEGSRCGWYTGCFAVISGLQTFSFAADEPKSPPTPPPFRQVEALPSVEQAARAAGLELRGLSPTLPRTDLRPGDAVTGLVSLTEGNSLRQWVVTVEAAAENEKEQKAGNRSARFFSSTGHEFRFGSSRAALQIRLFGPLRANDLGRKAATSPDVKRRRVLVGEDFLGLGFERVSSLMLRVREARRSNPTLPSEAFEIGGEPFLAEKIPAAREKAASLSVTEADERAVAGSVLALLEFFQITSNTPGLQEVLLSVVDIPWWSIIRRGGKAPTVEVEMLPSDRRLNPTVWGLPRSTPVFAFPFLLKLNDKPTLLCQLAVTTPRPPLLASAGIIGMAAGRPDGKGPVLTLQVVSSRVAESAAEKAP